MIHFLVALFFLASCRTQEIPSYVKICNFTDPKLGNCIRKSVISLRPKLLEGIPELDVPPLDPLLVPVINITQFSSGIPLNAVFKNVMITGAGKFRLRSVRADTSTDKLRMKIWFPFLQLNATYEINGQLLMMPISGRGPCSGNFSDIDGEVRMKLSRVEKNEEEHYKVDFILIEFTIGGATVSMGNLFHGDPELSRSMNQFINDNWRIVAAEIRPTLEKTIAEILTDVAGKFFDVYSIEKLFAM